MFKIREEGGVVVAIEGTAAEIKQLNDARHLEACAQLAARIDDADYTVSFADYVTFGYGQVHERTLEMYFMHLVSRLTAPHGALEVDLRGARVLARSPILSHGRPTGHYKDTPHLLDARIRLGDLIVRRQELAETIDQMEAFHESRGEPGPQANLRFGLDFIDFATAVVALKSKVAAE